MARGRPRDCLDSGTTTSGVHVTCSDGQNLARAERGIEAGTAIGAGAGAGAGTGETGTEAGTAGTRTQTATGTEAGTAGTRTQTATIAGVTEMGGGGGRNLTWQHGRRPSNGCTFPLLTAAIPTESFQ
jgi:hypothetical protein